MTSTTETSAERNRSSQTVSSGEPAGRFDWPLAYEAENLVRERIRHFCGKNSFAQRLAERMRDETGTDLFEWVDHLVLSLEEEKALTQAGFVRDSASSIRLRKKATARQLKASAGFVLSASPWAIGWC